METSLDEQARIDALLIEQALDPQAELDFNRDLEPGEKADDAVDYEDISDDDLTEDEGESAKVLRQEDTQHGSESMDDLGSLMQGELQPSRETAATNSDDGLDDLFGEGLSSPPKASNDHGLELRDGGVFEHQEEDLFGDTQDHVLEKTPPPTWERAELPPSSKQPALQEDAADGAPSREQLLQQQLFAMSRGGFESLDALPAPPENQEELLASLWPHFQTNTVLRFMDLLQPKRARYIGKTPLKLPKPVQPTKLNLDVSVDQEKSFKIMHAGHDRLSAELEREGYVPVRTFSPDSAVSDDEEESPDQDDMPPGTVTYQDIVDICHDWDVSSAKSEAEDLPAVDPSANDDLFRDLDDEWAMSLSQPLAKRRKLQPLEEAILNAPRFALASTEDPERVTSKLAKHVVLDLNDPEILIDEDSLTTRESTVALRSRPPHGKGGVGFRLGQRYNISNDEAYDLLKENHQSRVRSTIGNVAVTHSKPATRLQWPYYKTKLAKAEARAFHRPSAAFTKGEPVTFSKPRHIKRKHIKGKDAQQLFQVTRDLSSGDNSSVLLLEYSEEHPTMMSNFGMGSHIINYYRKKGLDDVTRPKLDIGEAAVLLPRDKSPFSLFGHIEPGETTPAIYNGMYKAPIFQQQTRPTDFLMVRNTTGIDGVRWYLRGIDHVRTVGQQFPSVDVPGPHSRKVTTAAKSRLKMVAYRQLRRSRSSRIDVPDVAVHFPEMTEVQIRQKMKEFMLYCKETKDWELRPTDVLPKEDVVRTMVAPEDVCLLESMQVGQQHLEDAGFSKDGADDDDDAEKEGQTVEQQLAPWYTSKNFLNAAAGKAMLQLHGEGDPTGRGEAFSFLKTSMKGGFKALGESVEDKLDAKKLKELGGHSYNVARQQKAYEESIRRIWDAQKHTLSATVDPSDTDLDGEEFEDADDLATRGMTPRSEAPTLPTFRRRDDESNSQMSKFSADSHHRRILRITRRVKDGNGHINEIQEIVRNAHVINQYKKHRRAREMEKFDINNTSAIGDASEKVLAQKLLEKELIRLERNKERRIARDKAKGIVDSSQVDAAESPDPSGATNSGNGSAAKGSSGTLRKCANCGQVGHIKTNKKCVCS